jgi:SAM-dependent methyltransferase
MENNLILDVGCGTGLLAVASEPFLGEEGRYFGIDVRREDIDFCNINYPKPQFNFIHMNTHNPVYASSQEIQRQKWNLDNDKFNLITALSVWTHLNEEDALFYFKEVERVLRPNGKAIITFFILDELYRTSLNNRSDCSGRYHMTNQNQWIFDQQAYGSDAWFHPKWAKKPEKAIGVTSVGLHRLTSATRMKLKDHYQGSWKEIPGLYFQDVLVFQKP